MGEEPLAASPGGQDARYRGALPHAEPQVLRSRARGTATLTTAFDPRRNPSRPGRPPEPAVTGPPVQKELLEGAGGGGNPWIGSLRGGCRSPAAGERRPAGAVGPRRVVSAGGCDAPPRAARESGRAAGKGAQSQRNPPDSSSRTGSNQRGGRRAGGSRKDNVCLREKSKQQRPEHYGLGVAEKAAARRTGARVGGCWGLRGHVGPQPGRVGPGEPAEGLRRETAV